MNGLAGFFSDFEKTKKGTHRNDHGNEMWLTSEGQIEFSVGSEALESSLRSHGENPRLHCLLHSSVCVSVCLCVCVYSYCILCCFPSAFYVIEGALTLIDQVILGRAVSSGEIEYLPKAYG